MVDNENQWESIEYSDDGGYDASYEDYSQEPQEYSETEYNQDYGTEQQQEMPQDYAKEYVPTDDDYDYENTTTSSKKGGSPFLVILLLLVLIGAGGFFLYTKYVSNNVQTSNNETTTEQPSEDASTEDMGDYFFNEAGGNPSDMMSVNFDEEGKTNVEVETSNGQPSGVVAQVSEPEDGMVDNSDLFNQPNPGDSANKETQQSNSAIMVSYEPVVRANPFKPPFSLKSKDRNLGNIEGTDFEIIEPPVSSVVDDNVTNLLQTKISGILYDPKSPAAIINLKGKDYFVKVGDTFEGYRIDSITQNRVGIKYKNNSYVASVGELFTKNDSALRPAVANLENKFAGRNRNNN